MCGIIGYVGSEGAAPKLTEGLRRLEYRGYDSVGLAVQGACGVEIRKDAGMVGPVSESLAFASMEGNAGIGHTRWATHGGVSMRNAHPHSAGKVVLAHNGVIENYASLKRELSSKGRVFSSDTDSEVIAHLIDENAKAMPLPAAIRGAVARLEGSYALLVMGGDEPGRLYAARRGSPLVLGICPDGTMAASDVSAMLGSAASYLRLEDGEMAVLGREGASILSPAGEPIQREPFTVSWSAEMAKKSGYPHFMRKEIDEQKTTLRNALSADVSAARALIDGSDRIHLIACGTSYHAAMVLAFLLSKAGKVAHAFIASDYPFVADPSQDTLVIALSQSGETADVLQALSHAKGCRKVAITNVVGSTICGVSDTVIQMGCGPEVGVAATKTFTAQLAIAYKLMLPDLSVSIPGLLEASLGLEPEIKDAAIRLKGSDHAFFLARAWNVPIAYEGSLKFKEISYIHSEAYPSGELKHGTLSLIEDGTPVIVLAPKDDVALKVLGNLKEAKARGAFVVSLTNDECIAQESDIAIRIPGADDPRLYPFALIGPLQLLAYHVSVLRGIDPDRPRNLAKSVTVE